jgi:hypothetical protein
LFENDIPPTSREEAYARRVRPPPERYDPDNLSHWSITMTVAWIIWGEIDAVRNEWDIYRDGCADWVFESDPVARAQVEKIAIDNISTGQIAPNDPSRDLRLRRGYWRFSPWKPSGWNRLCLTALAENIRPQVAIDSLWLAAGEGRIRATALECKNAKAFDGNLVEIPNYHWARLNRANEPSGKAMLSGQGRVYREVQFPRLDAKKLWPKSARSPEHDLQRPMAQQATKQEYSDQRSEIQPAPPVQTIHVTPHRLAEAKIEPEFRRWREQHPSGYIPTESEDTAHMKQFGVGRDKVRELRKKYPGRLRGQKKSDKPPNIRG